MSSKRYPDEFKIEAGGVTAQPVSMDRTLESVEGGAGRGPLYFYISMTRKALATRHE